MRRYTKSSKRKSEKISWKSAPDVKKRIKFLAENLGLNWIKASRVFVFRSENSSSRAYARTWGFPRIWQISLKEGPAYIIEVLSENFDRLTSLDQDKVLLHELTHIPKNFSGSLLPHIRRGKNSFHKKLELLVRQYLELVRKI